MLGHGNVEGAQRFDTSAHTDSPGDDSRHPAAPAPTRLLVASDIRLLRDSIADAVGRRQFVSVIGTAAHSAGVLAAVDELRPDVVLLDMAMPASLDVLRTITATASEPKIVVFAVAEADSDVLTCIEAGAVGYVLRDASAEDLIAAVASVGRGETLCSPRVAAAFCRRLAALSRSARPSSARGDLTHREQEIVRLLQQGLSNKEIAMRLCIESATVKNHVHTILGKLEVQHRWEVAARIRGSVPPQQPTPTARDSRMTGAPATCSSFLRPDTDLDLAPPCHDFGAAPPAVRGL